MDNVPVDDRRGPRHLIIWHDYRDKMATSHRNWRTATSIYATTDMIVEMLLIVRYRPRTDHLTLLDATPNHYPKAFTSLNLYGTLFDKRSRDVPI